MKMFWDKMYKGNNRIWGEEPSELAVFAVYYLKTLELNDKNLSILDIGCGYGRDAVYFSKHLRCTVLGIDSSKEAIDMAKTACSKASNIEFRCCDFTETGNSKYDVVFISNLYHFFKGDARQKLRAPIIKHLKPEGLLFLSTLSPNDPQDYGKGIPVPNEHNSFIDKVYLHFRTRNELGNEFNFLKIKELYEHEYYEHHSTGEVHHHISWILIGESAGTSYNLQ